MNTLTTSNTQYITQSTDLFKRWIAYLDIKPKSAETYNKAIKGFFRWLEDRGIKNPTREDVAAYRDELRATKAPSTVQTYVTAIRSFFAWCEEEGIYPNIARRIKGSKVDRQTYKRDYLTEAQARAILNGSDLATEKGARDHAIFWLMLTGGLRTVSIINANIEDLGTAGGEAVLYYKGKGRNEKAEFIKLSAATEAAIRSYLALRGETDPKAPLFSSTAHRNAGGRMTTRSVSRIAKDALRAQGLVSNRLCAHSFRHSAATYILKAGGSIEEVKEQLGHRDTATSELYAHRLHEVNSGTSQMIEDLLMGAV